MNKKFILPIALLTLVSLAMLVSAESLNLKLSTGWNLVALGADTSATGITFELSEPDFTKTLSIGGISHTFKISKFAEMGDPYLSIDGSEPKTNYYEENDKLFKETGAKIIGSKVLAHKKRIEYTLSDPSSCNPSEVYQFIYSPDTNKYLGQKDNVESYLNGKKTAGYRFASQGGAKWVYTKKSCSLGLDISKLDEGVDYNRLLAGWNFIGITQDMIGKTIFDIKGGCNIEKAYLWQASLQQWSFNLIEDTSAPDKFSSSDLSNGLVIKVASDCQLGTSGNSNINPPQIPN